MLFFGYQLFQLRPYYRTLTMNILFCVDSVSVEVPGFYIYLGVVKSLHVAHILRPRLIYDFFSLTPLAYIHHFSIYASYFRFNAIDRRPYCGNPYTCPLFLMGILYLIYAFLFEPIFSDTRLGLKTRARCTVRCICSRTGGDWK
jgi:hypothetical protein